MQCIVARAKTRKSVRLAQAQEEYGAAIANGLPPPALPPLPHPDVLLLQVLMQFIPHLVIVNKCLSYFDIYYVIIIHRFIVIIIAAVIFTTDPQDFIAEETSVEKAKEAFADLSCADFLLIAIDKIAAACEAAKSDGLHPSVVLSDSHMIFYGPVSVNALCYVRVVFVGNAYVLNVRLSCSYNNVHILGYVTYSCLLQLLISSLCNYC